MKVRINNKPTAAQKEVLRQECINKTNSRYITLNGVTKHISEWAKITGIKRRTISARILKLRWSAEKALTKKVGGHSGGKANVRKNNN